MSRTPSTNDKVALPATSRRQYGLTLGRYARWVVMGISLYLAVSCRPKSDIRVTVEVTYKGETTSRTKDLKDWCSQDVIDAVREELSARACAGVGATMLYLAPCEEECLRTGKFSRTCRPLDDPKMVKCIAEVQHRDRTHQIRCEGYAYVCEGTMPRHERDSLCSNVCSKMDKEIGPEAPERRACESDCRSHGQFAARCGRINAFWP